MNRRGFIKLSGVSLFMAGFLGIEKLPVFNIQYDPVAIDMDDVNAAKEFWVHFRIPMSKKLSAAFKDCEDNGITPISQHELKIAIVREIAFSGHAAFADEIFVDIKQECKQFIKSKFGA